jgi:hypothetical protein
VLADVIAEIAPVKQIHHEVQIFSVLESVVHVNDVGIVELSEDLSLVHHRFETPLREDACLGHLLHRVGLLSLLSFDLPHLAEATFANAVKIVEVALC